MAKQMSHADDSKGDAVMEEWSANAAGEHEDLVGLEKGDSAEDEASLQALYSKVNAMKERVDNYMSLLFFLVFVAIYYSILYLQANSFLVFQVSTAHLDLLPAEITNAGENHFSSSEQIYRWLNDTIIQHVWTDPYRGNGLCERPYEFMAWGDLSGNQDGVVGCASDCGQNPNVTRVRLQFDIKFATKADFEAATWNLCLLNVQDPLCIYKKMRSFIPDVSILSNGFVPAQLLQAYSHQLSLVDGEWKLVVDAPLASVTGSILNASTNAPAPFTPPYEFDEYVAQKDDPTERCREFTVKFVECIATYCTLPNGSPLTQSTQSTLFLNNIGQCSPSVINDHMFSHYEAVEASSPCITSDGSFSLVGNYTPDTLLCPTPYAPQQQQQQPPPPAPPLPAAPLPTVNFSTNPVAESVTTSLWVPLGPTDCSRLVALRFAVRQGLYTWIKDTCLFNHVHPLTPASSQLLTAFFCTIFGGPPTLADCLYTDAAGQPLTTDAQLAKEMGRVHGRLNITRDQQVAFTDIFLLGPQSMVPHLPPSTVFAFQTRLQALDSSVVTPGLLTCPPVAKSIDFSDPGYSSAYIRPGDAVTWRWADDKAHGLGRPSSYSPNPSSRTYNSLHQFVGFGGGDSPLARSTVCTPHNVGDEEGNLDPCVLAHPGDMTPSFSFTVRFPSEGTVAYGDVLAPPSSHGIIYVNDSYVDDLASTLEHKICAPGCNYGMLSDGVCQTECQTAKCAFDGGDCSCPLDAHGNQVCSCGIGLVRSTKSGRCCQPQFTPFHHNNSFPLTLPPLGSNFEERNGNFWDIYVPLVRTVAMHNKFSGLYSSCLTGSSYESYGFNPVSFFPHSWRLNSSTLNYLIVASEERRLPPAVNLYVEQVNHNQTYNENSSGEFGYSGSVSVQEPFSATNIPRGFDAYNLSGSPPSFHYFMDTNMNNSMATSALQYLVDGRFVDNATKLTDSLSLLNVFFTFQSGGKIAVTYDINTIPTNPYNTQNGTARFVLEILFLILLFWNIVGELHELYEFKRTTGRALNYLTSLWNMVDLLSLTLLIASTIVWLMFVFDRLRTYTLSPSYPMYNEATLNQQKMFFVVDPDPYTASLAAFTQLESMISFKTFYIALQGVSMLSVMLRLLKLLDFQPRLGVITRTITAALPDLVHFFVVFSVVFMTFALYANVVFGRAMPHFRSIPNSIITCLQITVNDTSANLFLFQLKGWELIAAVVWYVFFIAIQVSIVFNMLIAIIVKAFDTVQEQVKDEATMPTEVYHMCCTYLHRLLQPEPCARTNGRLMRKMRSLGASGIEGGPRIGPEVPVVVLEKRELSKDDFRALILRLWRRKVSEHVSKVLFTLLGSVPMKLEGVPPTRLEGYQKGGEEGMATEMPQDLRLDSLLRANLAMRGDIDGLRGDVGSLRGDIAELKAMMTTLVSNKK